MAFSIGGVQGIFSGIGGFLGAKQNAAGLKMQAQGNFEAAKFYKEAAGEALENKEIVESSNLIRQFQLGRKIFMTEEEGEAQAAKQGVYGGSAGDLLRMSMQQGGLAEGVLSQQGQLEERSYEMEARSLEMQSQQAVTAGNVALKASGAAMTSGYMSLLSGGLSLAGMFL